MLKWEKDENKLKEAGIGTYLKNLFVVFKAIRRSKLYSICPFSFTFQISQSSIIRSSKLEMTAIAVSRTGWRHTRKCRIIVKPWRERDDDDGVGVDAEEVDVDCSYPHKSMTLVA